MFIDIFMNITIISYKVIINEQFTENNKHLNKCIHKIIRNSSYQISQLIKFDDHSVCNILKWNNIFITITN